MDEKDRLLLTYLQNGLPLALRPFDILSAKIGIDSAELLVRIQRLKKEGVFGEIKAVLDPRAFRYQSAWVAAQFKPEEFESNAKMFCQHPGVIYGCERKHEFNFWFFITVPDGHDLELHVRCLEKLADVSRTLFLPVRKVLKGADLLNALDAATFPVMNERFEKRETPRSSDLTEEEVRMIRQLQEPFPLTDEPCRKIAADLKITENQALEWMKSIAKKGCLKRIGSSLRPAEVLPSARTLVVWQVPEEKLERMGPAIAEAKEVLYADQRPVFAEFPYALHTVIRADASAGLEVSMRSVQDRIGKWPFRELVTVREFKKEPMKYFPKELDMWWRESRHVAETAFHGST
jgi:DNA-binding Lrp family transcriptional regulator